MNVVHLFWLGMLLGVVGCNETPMSKPAEKAVRGQVLQSAAVPQLSPWDALASKDQRRPVPLMPGMALSQKRNMMKYLEGAQTVSAGLASRDWTLTLKGAKRMQMSEQMRRMCMHIGSAEPAFNDMTLSFQLSVDKLVEAIEAKSQKQTLEAMSTTLQRCTTCHSTFRQEIVSEKEWHDAVAAVKKARQKLPE